MRSLALPRVRPRGLRLLVLSVSARCDQRCVHCRIWQGAGAGSELGLAERLAIVDDAIACGVRDVLITGGEPLLSPHLLPIADRVRRGGVRLLLATNGMLLATRAQEVGQLFAEVYVSLDGAQAVTHDHLRGAFALERVRAGAAAIRSVTPSVRLVARSTLHARNLHEVEAIIATARGMGFDHVSFLALDASSDAFGGAPEARRPLVPSEQQVEAFEATVDRLDTLGAFRNGFVLEDASKLRRLARHLRATAGLVAFERPECDAPWWSSVVEADGSVRPCFFHGPVGDASRGLRAVRSSPGYQAALANIQQPNETCDRCVCPKKQGWTWRWGSA